MAKKKARRRPDNPRLWKKARTEALKKFKGVHSPQSMIKAVEIYKERGGGYLEPSARASES
jgi:hypothetical protein